MTRVPEQIAHAVCRLGSLVECEALEIDHDEHGLFFRCRFQDEPGACELRQFFHELSSATILHIAPDNLGLGRELVNDVWIVIGMERDREPCEEDVDDSN